MADLVGEYRHRPLRVLGDSLGFGCFHQLVELVFDRILEVDARVCLLHQGCPRHGITEQFVFLGLAEKVEKVGAEFDAPAVDVSFDVAEDACGLAVQRADLFDDARILAP